MLCKLTCATLAFAALPLMAQAEPPQLQSGTPVIYLADNLDEKDRLGWCIDTQGRGFSEVLHAHSCKPDRGSANDTQFSFDASSGQIRSVAFADKCMTLGTDRAAASPFGLFDCDAANPAQRFAFDPATQEIRIAADPSQCVVVGYASASAGPFMSRGLGLAACESADAALKQWMVLD